MGTSPPHPRFPFFSSARSTKRSQASGSSSRRSAARCMQRSHIATGHDAYEAWREKDHDDEVLAVALGCWVGEQLQREPPGEYQMASIAVYEHMRRGA